MQIAIRHRGKIHEAFDGFVVCHGTDTMAYSGGAFLYMIQNSARSPIVLRAPKASGNGDFRCQNEPAGQYRLCS